MCFTASFYRVAIVIVSKQRCIKAPIFESIIIDF